MILEDGHEFISINRPDGFSFKEVCGVADDSWAKVIQILSLWGPYNFALIDIRFDKHEMTCQSLKLAQTHWEAWQVLTIDLLAWPYFCDYVSIGEIWVFGDWMWEEEASFVGLVEPYHSFGMSSCWTCLIGWFFIIPCNSAVLLLVEGVKCVGKCWFREVDHGIEVLKFCSCHGWIVVSVGVGAVFGRYFEHDPPGNWLAILVEAVESCRVANEENNKKDHNKQ